MIANECFLCNDPNVGLSLNETRSYIKCYMGDTGLLVSHVFNENELLEDEVYKQILGDKLSMNEGIDGFVCKFIIQPIGLILLCAQHNNLLNAKDECGVFDCNIDLCDNNFEPLE